MRNCIILGSGRSGTSMVAGSLATSGYTMGNSLLQPNPSNPKGFFEDNEINSINEDLLESVVPARPLFLGKWFFKERPRGNARWLASVRLNAKIDCPPEIGERIRAVVEANPYCYKDPRFCYTLPAWRPFLIDTVYVCVFRHPSSTAASILKEISIPKYRNKISLNYNQAIRLWTLQYQHIVDIHSKKGEWLFLHYNQVLQGDGLDLLSNFLHAKVDKSFPDSNLRRTKRTNQIPIETQSLYDHLCILAKFENQEDW